MSTLYNKDQIKDSITGYLWYDAPWAIIRAVYPFIGDSLLDIGGGSGIMNGVFNVIKSAEGKEYFGGSIDESFENIGWKDNSFYTVMSSHVLEHLKGPFEISEMIEKSISLSQKRIIHIVPDGDVNDKNLGTPHRFIFNRINFRQLFLKYEESNRIKRIHYGPIKGDRMDSLMYVGEVVK